MEHTNHRPLLSVCMIVRDEEEFLDRCLESVKDIAGEIVIADTGSTDDSAAIAQRYGARVYPVKWQGSFARARNYALRKAKGEWLLLLDADEVLDPRDTGLLTEYIRSASSDGCFFTMLNYIGPRKSGLYTMHNAFRLLRNNGQYHYKGAIHEQISRRDGQRIPVEAFEFINVRLHHYGYLDEVVRRKKKRERNIPLLLAELKKEPENPFFLFNLANDYLACGEHEKALELFNRAYEHVKEPAQAFVPHLMYRRAVTLFYLGRYAEAALACAQGIGLFPACADLEFLRGSIYARWAKYTLAIDSFNRCMEMETPPASLRFMEDSTTIRPLEELEDVYRALYDYPRALECCIKLLKADSTRSATLFRLAANLDNLIANKDEMANRLESYFSSLDHLPNLLMLINILIKERLYLQAERYLERAELTAGQNDDITYLRARLDFAQQRFAKAQERFDKVLNHTSQEGCVQAGMCCECAQHLFLISLITGEGDPEECLAQVRACCCGVTQRVYAQALHVWNGVPETALAPDENWSVALEETKTMLDKVLCAREFEAFERLLPLLNHIDSREVLIMLAQLYREHGFAALAAKQVLRSVKELDYLNPLGVEILAACPY